MPTMTKKSKNQPEDDEQAGTQLSIRMPDDLRHQLKQDADFNLRSLNKHIIWVLREYANKLAGSQKDGA